MTVPVLLIVLGFVSAFFLTVICFSLRDFSRSRLEDICKQQKNLQRFGFILRQHEQALLLSETTLLLLVITLTWTVVPSPYFQIFLYPDTVSLVTITTWLFNAVSGSLVVGMTFVFLPWSLSRVSGERLLYRVWPLMAFVNRVTSPAWRVIRHLDRINHRVFGIPEPDSDDAASLLTEELLSVVDESQREGVIQSNASTMIHRVVDLQTEDVAAIMTPRTDMVTISSDTLISEALHKVLEIGFSRIPVIRSGVDDIVGILYARDLLASLSEPSEASRQITSIAREVLYAPETQGIGDLLEAMRQKKVHMAIVVDEYSGVSGLVTLEDILEEIVGEISDEYDSEDRVLLKKHENGCTEVDARYHLDDLNREYGYGFPEDEEFDTIGGFVLYCFGRIPAAGEEYRWQNLKLTVLEADERRLARVSITPLIEPSAISHQRSASA